MKAHKHSSTHERVKLYPGSPMSSGHKAMAWLKSLSCAAVMWAMKGFLSLMLPVRRVVVVVVVFPIRTPMWK